VQVWSIAVLVGVAFKLQVPLIGWQVLGMVVFCIPLLLRGMEP
jgi:hypothetical protein